MKYILSIDQSTQATKAVLLDEKGKITGRADCSHEQIINEKGWVSHNQEEIYQNLQKAVKAVVEASGIAKSDLQAVGISNQRETVAAWDKNGKAIGHAVVWQCKRAEEIAERLKEKAEEICKKTGLPLSPYFSASKMTWLIENEIREEEYHLGTMDSWLLYKLTAGKSFKTDYTNASRTQLLNLHTLKWDEELCGMFGIPLKALPEICDSNSCFGYTDFEGYLNEKIPIYAVLGDSHGALFGQGCHTKGMVKTTYGTGSSIMMNIGGEPLETSSGLAVSLAWRIDGKAEYVLEGNINYTGAVVTWLQNDMHMIENPKELEEQLKTANKEDSTILVPAFTGLSAPYWRGDAKALLYGMTRSTGRAEVIKASVESIAYQITDVLKVMELASNTEIKELRVDGGPTRNKYLMQFQSDLADTTVCVASSEELSAIGAGYMAGIAVGLYNKEEVFQNLSYQSYKPEMSSRDRGMKYEAWKKAVAIVLNE
ncbi:glycerol kinase [Anaerocolumna jejuensis DSM 15929]|uniref:ATP:glycerol 3-phosphotransferase n=1 Tax=Anaerocolumna jejuensis DSM 15929 TaxID=1121322 RepID=A0A1M6TVY4_9FIRM|nr:glycerol kinase [Anaerocolumna jejuensis]SHK61182.1 glycerol kinase [Anaerocolumna jejuensis DSM 15929]